MQDERASRPREVVGILTGMAGVNSLLRFPAPKAFILGVFKGEKRNYPDSMKKALPVFAILLLGLPLAAQAAPHPKNDPASVLNRILGVLQTDPDSASDTCVEALKELHKTQGIVANQDTDSNNQDAAVARDVLESDFEETIEVCGADARRLCRTKGESDPKLPPLCAAAQSRPPSENDD
ncbi:hypothetical protein GCM10007207_25530 [Asaia siamensis]|uniref:Uncharacterized protein n=2 Tax=Asaia TaxID=91914 RepID=A0ABQ1MKL9_9PROT|nr:hypothetical protein GCM10007207_25530 [Asaia siamensis]